MKILLVHNYYQQPGGEDVVFEQERNLLTRKGHQVLTYTRSNKEVEALSRYRRIGLLKTMVSAADSKRDIRTLLQNERPDVVHIHNTFMLASPSIYYACAEARVPTVQTLHNYRLLCPAVTLYRDGHVCEECSPNNMLRSIKYGCYRGSRSTTGAVAAMLTVHHRMGTWSDKIDAYIALTEFAKRKFIDGGLPAHKLHVKPNFVDPDPGERTSAGNYALFVGRISAEKGLSTLLNAWKLSGISLPLKIAGDGPDRTELESLAQSHRLDHVEFLGRLDRPDVFDLIKGALFVVVPSLWYEGFPMVLAESFACGVPVLASRLGAMKELIDDGICGLHFEPGDAVDLARKTAWAAEHPDEMASMGTNARHKYELSYDPESTYETLMEIYKEVIRHIALGQTKRRGFVTADVDNPTT